MHLHDQGKSMVEWRSDSTVNTQNIIKWIKMIFTSSTYKEDPIEDLAFHNWEASFTTKRRETWKIAYIQVVGMSPPPLRPHNHLQTHLKLLGRLPLPALVSADLHTTKSLKLSGTWTFLSLELSRHGEASRKGQTPFQNLISGLNRLLCSCSCA